jgi:hypothetical protein
MSKFTIEKNIKMIEAHPTYPYARMVKGDSFKFSKKLAKSVGITAAAYGKNNHMKFVTKYTETEGRCWRTK